MYASVVTWFGFLLVFTLLLLLLGNDCLEYYNYEPFGITYAVIVAGLFATLTTYGLSTIETVKPIPYSNTLDQKDNPIAFIVYTQDPSPIS